MNWRSLNKIINTLTEEELLALLEEEVSSGGRTTIIIRLHQRYCALRCAREREVYLAAASAA